MNKKKIKEEGYRLAKAKYWARNPPPLKEAGERYPRREELHER